MNSLNYIPPTIGRTIRAVEASMSPSPQITVTFREGDKTVVVCRNHKELSKWTSIYTARINTQTRFAPAIRKRRAEKITLFGAFIWASALVAILAHIHFSK